MDVSTLFLFLVTTISMTSEMLFECYVQTTDNKVITIFRLNQPVFDRYLTGTIKEENLTSNFLRILANLVKSRWQLLLRNFK